MANEGSTVTSEPLFLDATGCSTRYQFSVRHWHRLVDSGKAPRPTRFGRLVRWRVAGPGSLGGAGMRPRTENPVSRLSGGVSTARRKLHGT